MFGEVNGSNKLKFNIKINRTNAPLIIYLTVIATRSRISDSFTETLFFDKTCCFPNSTLPGQLMYGAAIIG